MKRPENGQITGGGPIGHIPRGPRALLDDYLAVVRWLHKAFPDKRSGIEFCLGRGTDKLPITPTYWSPTESISRTIARLEAEMRMPTDSNDAESVRKDLSYAYSQAGRYNDAAKLLTTSPPTYCTGLINYDWEQWSILRRQAEALIASEKDYASLAAARPIIENVHASRSNVPKDNGQPWLSDAEVAKQLVAIGPAVLADVMSELATNRFDECRPWLAVVERLGSARDAPVLISRLAVVTSDLHDPDPKRDENDRLTVAAVEKCLEKITKAKPEGRDRAVAWSKWWAENSMRITADR